MAYKLANLIQIILIFLRKAFTIIISLFKTFQALLVNQLGQVGFFQMMLVLISLSSKTVYPRLSQHNFSADSVVSTVDAGY